MGYVKETLFATGQPLGALGRIIAQDSYMST